MSSVSLLLSLLLLLLATGAAYCVTLPLTPLKDHLIKVEDVMAKRSSPSHSTLKRVSEFFDNEFPPQWPLQSWNPRVTTLSFLSFFRIRLSEKKEEIKLTICASRLSSPALLLSSSCLGFLRLLPRVRWTNKKMSLRWVCHPKLPKAFEIPNPTRKFSIPNPKYPVKPNS